MASDNTRWNVSMHDGTVIDARIATADLMLVQDLAESNKKLLARLYRQVHDGGQPDIDLVHELDEVFFVDGKLRPLTRLLLKNAIEVIGNGIYRMIDPFVDNTHNREVLANLEERRSIFLENLSRVLYDG